MVYLLARMGSIVEALNIIMHKVSVYKRFPQIISLTDSQFQIKDIEMAIEFCKEHNDDDLWNILIDESIKQPEIVTKVLDGIVGKFLLFIYQFYSTNLMRFFYRLCQSRVGS